MNLNLRCLLANGSQLEAKDKREKVDIRNIFDDFREE